MPTTKIRLDTGRVVHNELGEDELGEVGNASNLVIGAAKTSPGFPDREVLTGVRRPTYAA